MASPYETSPPSVPAGPPILTVGQLTSELKDLLESSFPAVWVSGEISNFSRPSSGHCYFTLKDDAAQIRAWAPDDIDSVRWAARFEGRFVVVAEESARGLPGWVNLVGIESPGLTSCLEIAREVRALLGA